MTLRQLEQEGKIRPHRTSPKEIAGLFELVRRDIRDSACEEISYDRRYATIYNAALGLATIILCCKGFQSHGKAHHFTAFQTLKIILGGEHEELADYLDSCRIKRNAVDYDFADIISEKEFTELAVEVKRFHDFVTNWIKDNYPKLSVQAP